MSDVVRMPVQTVGGNFQFTPDTLEIEVISQDVLAGTSMIRYRLYSSIPFDTNKYYYRNWSDIGTIIIPTSVVANASSNGQLNINLFNQLLAEYNLVVAATS